MDVIKSNNFDNINIGPVVLALGTFDGVHRGHMAVIEEAQKQAEELKFPVGVYTFYPHPLKILKPAVAPRSIISKRQKIEIMSNLKLDYYLQQKFTPDFAAMEYKQFVRRYLVDKFMVKHIVVGEDFKLGT
ncbi:MAG: adenylyltransferase/cytidyltransferase family protein, partial [Halanaerobiaceae bacterium]